VRGSRCARSSRSVKILRPLAGAESLVLVTQIGPGPQCAAGGEEIQVGVDTNGDGVLELSEVQHTAYVCNGTSAGEDADGGVCVPSSLTCNGQQPQICVSTGTWQDVGPTCADIVPGGGGGKVAAKAAGALTGEACCAGACIDTTSDPNNCGSCGNVCTTTDPNATGATCDGNGQCEPICNAPLTACGGQCVDTNTDANNCGGCGGQCPASGDVCAQGVCEDPPLSCAQADNGFGCCVGNSLYYCVANAITLQACAGGTVCGWNATANYYDCVAPPGGADPSGTYAIQCSYPGFGQ